MPASRIVVIGASSGGIEALRVLVGGLPAGFPAPVCVVVHTSPQSPGLLAEILNRAGPLTVVHPANGERLQAGHVYIAPPDRHLLIEPGQLCLSRGPRENRFRPAIDPLFRSAAQVYGPGAIGVVLSGSLDDGAAGLATIKRLGGIAMVQDPTDAMFPSMPESAIRQVDVDHAASAAGLASLLVIAVNTPVDELPYLSLPHELEAEVRIAREEDPFISGITEIGEPSPFACPECHGVLLRMKAAHPVRFRCHTGHTYTTGSLIAAVNDGIEDSYWSTIRALQEGVLLLEHLRDHRREGDMSTGEVLDDQIRAARAQIAVIRQLVNERASLLTSGTASKS